ncbi:hypothetical protein K493DRAFT_371963 [Basidiobolus meristosporus CBS 931.73]|uniref:Uncharacterized protein n=1 Tax=Basidiobolus meristosporus CBS 931.73 TaxID=1314790 RepID=A0A1Y1YCF4_9FUNG|nr:hypothetical protein K493DRAFT_371963 [Basidiobolus meristosporus CBS 931.73]|eukprot:ORX95613.1 hypothetical protein K493DRAFT_371963 [Basidiobolus meristosporus CBS 931.73]
MAMVVTTYSSTFTLIPAHGKDDCIREVGQSSSELLWIGFLRVVRNFTSRSIGQLPTPLLSRIYVRGHANQTVFRQASAEDHQLVPNGLEAASDIPRALTNVGGMHWATMINSQGRKDRKREVPSSNVRIGGKLADQKPNSSAEDKMDALYEGMHLFGTSWSTVFDHFGENGVINQVQLKDKARNKRRRRIKAGLALKVHEEDWYTGGVCV